ncbi:MAG: hypothetical protein JNJ84_05255 [Rhodobacteraceae bacterium]|nr:hypothetical protein [Paracoccaceae bacterium]
MNNIEMSELVIAKILGLLLEWGLSERTLQFRQLGLEDEYQPFFATSVKWLEAEGIIRTTNVQTFISGGAFVVGPTLTAHGLALMGKRMSIGEITTTIGEAVLQTRKETSYYTGVGDLAGGFVGGLFKSLGGG